MSSQVTEFDRFLVEAHRGLTLEEHDALDALEDKLRAAWERREAQKLLEARRGAA